MTVEAPVAVAGTDDPQALAELAANALRSGEEEEAIPAVRAGAERHNHAALWHWAGLLERALDEHERALESFAQASRLAPNNFRIMYLRAQCSLEAGLPSVAQFEHARFLRPQNGAALINLTAALAAEGQADRAVSELSSALESDPMWAAGHGHFAQLMATLGRPAEATASLEAALHRFPAEPGLWETLLYVQLRRGDYQSLSGILDRARSAAVVSPEFAMYEAIHAAEFADETFPAPLFDAAPADAGESLRNWRIRHLLRFGALEAALPLVDEALQDAPTAEIWALAATAWRLAGDERSNWLEGDPALVSVTNLTDSVPPLDDLASTLRALHLAEGEYLDQSVRGGTQTGGLLFTRIDPVIRHLRSAVVEAVENYIAQLPAEDARHPLLRERRDRRVRFSGSWSVRLGSGGRHSNHIHPQGWISSALYIALPQRKEGEPEDAGWLTLGEPDDNLGLDLPPWRKIEPKPGQLVLFPSWMWHGTRPFRDGERLTVAFDVMPPY
jgi:tetratricopeptide (TPR) repeat protein